MNTVVHDLRGYGKWSDADKARECDLVICSATMEEKPIPGKRTLIHCGASLLEWHGDTDEYNTALDNMLGVDGLMYPYRDILVNDPDQKAFAIDLTRRMMPSNLAKFWCERFDWADGIHVDYFCELSWLFPDIPLAYWDKYRAGLGSLVGAIKKLRPDWIVTGQNWQILAPECSYLSGIYVEQSPAQWRLSFPAITESVDRFRSVASKLDPAREWCQIIELRYPERFSQAYKDALKAWVEQEGYYVSVGRDATAGGVL